MVDQNSDRTSPLPGSTTSKDVPLAARTDPQKVPVGGNSPGAGKDTSPSANLKEGSRMAEEARQDAEDMAGRAKEQGRSMLERQKDSAAAQVDSVTHAFRNAAGQLQGEGEPQAGRYISMAAEQLESLGRGLREKNMDTLFRDAEDLARRSPGAFFAASLIAGFLFSRFLKSSAQHSHEQADREFDASSSSYPDSAPARSQSMGSGGGNTASGAGNRDDAAVSTSGSGSPGSAAMKEAAADGTGATGMPSSSQSQPGGNIHGNR